MKNAILLLLVLALFTPSVKSQENWFCLGDCQELDSQNLPGNAGPAQIILIHPDYPDCQLLVTYRAWFCLVPNGSEWEPMYRLSVTGWGLINIHDPDCAGLIADMYPTGYPGPVDQDFAGYFQMLWMRAPVVG